MGAKLRRAALPGLECGDRRGGMLSLALAGTDPVVFLEAEALRQGRGLRTRRRARGYYETERERAERSAAKRAATSRLLPTARLLRPSRRPTSWPKYGLSAESSTLRRPLNYDKLIASRSEEDRSPRLTSDAVERGSLHSTRLPPTCRPSPSTRSTRRSPSSARATHHAQTRAGVVASSRKVSGSSARFTSASCPARPRTLRSTRPGRDPFA